MKCQDLFSSENKKKNINIVVCFSCDWHFKGNTVSIIFHKGDIFVCVEVLWPSRPNGVSR